MARLPLNRRGSSSTVLLIALPVLFASAAISIEVANAYQVKREAQVAADSAAQAAIQDLDLLPGGIVTAMGTASRVAALNGFTVNPNLVEFGTWDPTARAFAPSRNPARVHAIHLVVGKRDVGFGLASIAFGSGPLDVAASSTSAILVRGHNGALIPQGACNPIDPTCVVATADACTPALIDTDGDGTPDLYDNDDDDDGVSDDADSDDDNDGISDDHESRSSFYDTDHDGIPDDVDSDDDNDGISDDADSDDDGDGISDDHDRHPHVNSSCGRASDHHVLQVHDDNGSDRAESDVDSNSEDVDYHDGDRDRQVGIQYYSLVE